ncbi:mitochondrial import inner membrane translocase subunit TIM14 isoform X2 [Malaclemys terrapin pileata]|uniref:mitochondrial import inner membrane translocase subunit TIM14 isoform X2 n=1 Tax=Malaclemys terrapin pileata TaxID=2991368 RepID=UPI0023A8F875|nr:mitochondrial import inner membrane translocase subunit TIM14 isoform X2 [Malaclemys terrapin pileata]XP_053896449.1 mitochondrial import inner membrane translocase subunit TIM14 isoform X2 [Malaclemys terrapin pileata]
MASTVIAVGLTIAAAGFAGRYALQAMKQMEPQVKQALQNLPKSAFSGYYRGGFDPKMTKREAALILGVRNPCPDCCKDLRCSYPHSYIREMATVMTSTGGLSLHY